MADLTGQQKEETLSGLIKQLVTKETITHFPTKETNSVLECIQGLVANLFHPSKEELEEKLIEKIRENIFIKYNNYRAPHRHLKNIKKMMMLLTLFFPNKSNLPSLYESS